MKKDKIITRGYDQTQRLGSRVAKVLHSGSVVCLFGDLGSGKTTFVKGMAQGMGVDPREVHSPTFVLMCVYEGRKTLYHFDLYRIERREEIFGIGYEEFLYGDGIAVVEWAERFGELLPKEHLSVQMKHLAEQEREIHLTAHGAAYEEILSKIKNRLK